MTLSRETLRELLISTGARLLEEEGLGSGAERLTFKRVFDRLNQDQGIRVSNASVIGRIWTNNRDFQSEVLTRVVGDENPEEIRFTMEAAAAVLGEADVSTLAGRRLGLSEICRRGGAAHTGALADSRTWHLFIGIWGNLASHPETEWDRRVLDAARATYENLSTTFDGIFRGIMDVFRLRLRPGLTVRDFTVAVTALAEGCAMRSRIDERAMPTLTRPGPDGIEREWTLFSVGLEALVQQFYDMDPD
ncbi:MAG TPA: hypothetical protein VG435_08525 [Acidimicrobiales bacterium]|jgi:hypothetical protein|nr:hypothetical protein [Acidimicrobiales bacterium]